MPDPEVGSSTVSAVVFYLKTLKPPPRRNPQDPDVLAGEAHFAAVGCAGCHVPTLRTGASPLAPLHQADFHPYTDLLLHDMGPELDDGYTEGIALTSEWRTAPLWGVGLASAAQGGRATCCTTAGRRACPKPSSFTAARVRPAAPRSARSPRRSRTQVVRFLGSL